MPKDRFISKTNSGKEEYAVSPMTFPATVADCGDVCRCYSIEAQGEKYRWIRSDPSDNSLKVSANTLDRTVYQTDSLDFSARQVGSGRDLYRSIVSS